MPMKKGCHHPERKNDSLFCILDFSFLLVSCSLLRALALDASASITLTESFNFTLEGKVEITTDGVLQS